MLRSTESRLQRINVRGWKLYQNYNSYDDIQILSFSPQNSENFGERPGGKFEIESPLNTFIEIFLSKIGNSRGSTSRNGRPVNTVKYSSYLLMPSPCPIDDVH